MAAELRDVHPRTKGESFSAIVQASYDLRHTEKLFFSVPADSSSLALWLIVVGIIGGKPPCSFLRFPISFLLSSWRSALYLTPAKVPILRTRRIAVTDEYVIRRPRHLITSFAPLLAFSPYHRIIENFKKLKWRPDVTVQSHNRARSLNGCYF